MMRWFFTTFFIEILNNLKFVLQLRIHAKVKPLQCVVKPTYVVLKNCRNKEMY